MYKCKHWLRYISGTFNDKELIMYIVFISLIVCVIVWIKVLDNSITIHKKLDKIVYWVNFRDWYIRNVAVLKFSL